MRPDYSENPRERLEAQLTALALGELPGAEAAIVRAAMEKDVSLANLYAQIEQTIELVREAAANPGPELSAPATPLTLSPERRQQLQAAFKTCALPVRSREPNWIVPMSIAAVLVALIGSVLILPVFWERPRLSARLTSTRSLVRGTDFDFKAKDRVVQPTSGRRPSPLEPAAQQVGALPQLTANRLEETADHNGRLSQKPSADKAAADERTTNFRVAPSETEKAPAANGVAGVTFGGAAGGGFGGGVAIAPPTMLDRDRVSDSKTSPLELAAKPPAATPPGAIAQMPDRIDNLSVLAGPRPVPPTMNGWLDYDNDASVSGTITASPSSVAGGVIAPEKHFRFGLDDQESARRQLAEPGVTDFFAKVGQAGAPTLPAAHGTAPLTDIPVLGDTPSLGVAFSADGAAQGGPIGGRLWGQIHQREEKLSEQPAGAAAASEARTAPHAPVEAAPQLAQLTVSEAETLGKRNSIGLLARSAGDEVAGQRESSTDKSAAKKDLKTQEGILDSLQLRIAQERTDIGKSKQQSPVEIVDLARGEAERGATMFGRARELVSGKAARTARVEIARDAADVAPLLFGAQSQNTFDPYFIQTEFEKVKSKAVLERVIEKLNLNQAWAQTYGDGRILSNEQAYQLLVRNIDVRQAGSSNVIDIRVSSPTAEEAARIANTIAEVYRDVRDTAKTRQQQTAQELLAQKEKAQEQTVASAREQLQKVERESQARQADAKLPKPAVPVPALTPQPEIQTGENAFSTFSLHVSDVSFKLAAASLEKGQLPEAGTIRSEEFINAFDYRDPEPAPGMPVAFAWERARYSFAHDRDLLRLSIKTAAAGRQPGAPLNIVVLLDRSGSMERADRVQIMQEALRVLAGQLQAQDRVSVITFARTARLWADGLAGNEAGPVLAEVSKSTPEGGTNLEEAIRLGYQTAQKHYVARGGNRVVLFTDGAANLGNVDPEALKEKVETYRKQGIALDCYGVGWEGYDDDVLESLSRNGDGRYRFLNTPDEAASGFAEQLAGAFHVAASDVKVQVEFNPKRVTLYRQFGYAKHQLTKEQFRDNTVDAAEIGAAESGTALYSVQVNSAGEGPLAVVRVRYKMSDSSEVHEQEWAVPYTGQVLSLEQASASLRLAGTVGAFAEWLGSSPYAAEVTAERLLECLKGVSQSYGVDPRPKKLEAMIAQANSLRR